MNRRGILKFAGSALLAAGAAALLPAPALATASSSAQALGVRRLAFINTHTGDQFSDAYWESGNYVSGALDAIKHVMRDHRTNEVHDIDPRLLDELHQLNGLVGAAQPYQIISGYRSPATNAALHANSDGVATHSLHMEGRAIDIRMAGVDLTRLHDAALSMGAGGVGFYPSSDFIHVDTGRVRHW
jgi:uncharacterized protein YcbK (DUF882 family)